MQTCCLSQHYRKYSSQALQRIKLVRSALAVGFTPGMNREKMNERADHVMGFDQTKTTHHFRLASNGGSIEVTANSETDIESRDQIRIHLGHIARMFAEGNFKAPMLIHDQIPPGVPIMKELKEEIQYEFEETEPGGTIRIRTNNSQAREAIFNFLRFQIKEHQTGDSFDITEKIAGKH